MNWTGSPPRSARRLQPDAMARDAGALTDTVPAEARPGIGQAETANPSGDCRAASERAASPLSLAAGLGREDWQKSPILR
jgi:hypothetical protein